MKNVINNKETKEELKLKKDEQKETKGEASPETIKVEEPSTEKIEEKKEETSTLIDINNEIGILKEELKNKTEEATGNLDNLLRLKAEFENFKKRAEKQKSDFYKYANEGLVEELLPVMDNFQRAIESAGNDNNNFEAFKNGIGMISQQLISVLDNIGLKPIESLNVAFDPVKHEAISQTESSDHEENTVIEEFQKGYYFKDKILRHSKVVVSKKTTEKAEKLTKEE